MSNNSAVQMAQQSVIENMFFMQKVYLILLFMVMFTMGTCIYVLMGEKRTAFRDGYSAAISDFSEAGIEPVCAEFTHHTPLPTNVPPQ